MHIERIELQYFRNYETADISFPNNGVIVFFGRNGQGKTNMLEAIDYVTTLRSFRASTTAALVNTVATTAVVRAFGWKGEREVLVETEIAGSGGRNRTLVNKQALKKSADIAEFFTSVVFAPDDLQLVKGGPALRRHFLDDLLARSDHRLAALQHDVDRVLRQRNTLLRQSSGRLTSEIAATLDVWDQRFSQFGEQLGEERQRLVTALRPVIQESYIDISDSDLSTVDLQMLTEWRSDDGHLGLAKSLENTRKHDIQRGVTTVGPHRDELDIRINTLPSRTHASQGEQRTLALALRLASYRYLKQQREDAPLLLLDDVFSELDAGRSAKLLTHLSEGQMFLSTATELPPGVRYAQRFTVEAGKIT